MNISVGIVGLPNVGKSTLFNALLKRQIADASNYPFCTIEPNIGVVEVPDPRLWILANVVKTNKIVPAVVKFVDIAGLVKGAAEGEGLGNKFLSHIREVNVICHVVRYFKDENVVHVAGKVDPKSDIEIINSELILADLETLERIKEVRNQGIKEEEYRRSAVEKLKKELDMGKLAKDVDLSEEEKEAIKELQLLTMKPVIYVENVDEEDLILHPGGVMASDAEPPRPSTPGVVRICAKIEAELADLSSDEQKEYLKQLGLEKSGLERLIQVAYKTLGLISFLTAGEKEVRAWTITNVTKAPQAAGVIHTDFEKNFIKAEVVNYEDFVKFNGWHACRENGKARLEGKEYVMGEGDVVEFKVGA